MRRLFFVLVVFLTAFSGQCLASDYYVSFRSGYSFSRTVDWDEDKLLGAEMDVKIEGGRMLSLSVGRKFEFRRIRLKLEFEGCYGKNDIERVKNIRFWTVQGRLPVRVETGPYGSGGKLREYWGTLNAYWESKNWTPFFDMYMGFGIGGGKAYLDDFEIEGVTSKARDFDGGIRVIHLDVGLFKAFRHAHLGIGYRYTYTGTVDLDSFEARFPKHIVNAFLTVVF